MTRQGVAWVLARPCPKCRAGEGEHCRTATGNPNRQPHAARLRDGVNISDPGGAPDRPVTHIRGVPADPARVLATPCPACGAEPHKRCMGSWGRLRLSQTHLARVRDAGYEVPA